MRLEDEPEFTEVEVALDSACARHVASKADFPNYVVVEGDGARRGQEFVTAAGDTIRNEGEVAAAFLTQDKESINSTFQITAVTRPLWSVSQILDNLPADHEASFKRESAVIRAADGKVLAKFERRGGLYVSMLKLRNPKHPGFQRQG